MTLCWSLSAVAVLIFYDVVVVVVVVVLCIETLMSADSFKDTRWCRVMARYQLDWAGLQEVDFDMCSIRVIALTWIM